MSDCPYHAVPLSRDEASPCPLHKTADALLDALELMDIEQVRLPTGAIVIVIDGADLGHATISSNLQMGVALNLLEREVARLRKALELD